METNKQWSASCGFKHEYLFNYGKFKLRRKNTTPGASKLVQPQQQRPGKGDKSSLGLVLDH